MSTVIEISDSLILARQLYSQLNAEHIAELKKGCDDCMPVNYKCLGRLIRALEWEISKGFVSEIAERLYVLLLLILGGGVIKIPPTVNAGSDQTAESNQSVNFLAVATAGSAAIVSYVWSKVSGGTVDMSGTNTSQLTVSGIDGNMPVGEYVFRVIVTDANGLTGRDTVKLTVSAVSVIAYYGSSETNAILTQSEIQAGLPVSFNSGSDVRIPWGVETLSYLWFAIPIGESIKNYYTDLSNSLNQASIGTSEDLFGAPTVVGGYNFYITNYLSTYFVANPALRGLVFTRIAGEDELNSTGFPIPID